ncbi:MAG: TldD/PmbA family protein [Thermoplasmatota archaeon]
MSDLLPDAESLVSTALAKGADQAEVFLSQGASIDVDVESGRLAGSSRSQNRGGSVRVVRDHRLGFAYFTRLEQAPSAIDRALAQARLSPELPLDLPSPEPLQAIGDHWDESLAELDPAIALDAARDIIQGVDVDATISGGIGISWGEEALANSHGVACADRATMMQGYTSLVLEGETTVNAWETTSNHGIIDAHAMSLRLSETVTSLANPAPADDGPADIILRPDAGSELIVGLMEGSLDGDPAMRGKSFWSNKLGEPVAHKGLQLRDAPHMKGALGSTPFDGEGRATRDAPLVLDGHLATYLFDTRDAAKHGQDPTRHATREGFKSPPGTGTHHVVLEHANTQSLEQLIQDVDHGYLVDSVLGAHTANGTTGDFSVTAPNVWRIRDGALDGACKEIALGGNLPKLLMHLDGVSDDPKASLGSRIPAMRLRNVHVST